MGYTVAFIKLVDLNSLCFAWIAIILFHSVMLQL